MIQQAYQHHSQIIFEEGKIIWEIVQIIKISTKQPQNQAIMESLIKWKNLPAANLTWEEESFIKMHPQLPKR